MSVTHNILHVNTWKATLSLLFRMLITTHICRCW